MNLDFVIALGKRAALFSYSRSVENIVYFYFVRDLDIGMHYFPSRIQHTLLEIQIFEQGKCHFYLEGGSGNFSIFVHFQ